MRDKFILTVGIPTYNRRSAAIRCISNIIEDNIYNYVNVLIIDNNSTDGTFDKLISLCEKTPISVLKNDLNIGFSGNTVRLINNCITKYMLWSSDEDDIIIENLIYLINFLEKFSPVFVAPQYYINNTTLYRGRKATQLINLNEIWSFGHLPGLVFEVNTTNTILKSYKFWVKEFPNAARFYPQIMILASLLTKGKCYWWDRPIVKQVEYLDDQHKIGRNGAKYYYISSRWDQNKDFTDYFNYLINGAPNDDKEALSTLLDCQSRWFLSTIESSIRNERPDLSYQFTKGLQHVCFNHLGFMRKIVYIILINPNILMYKIKSKFYNTPTI